METRSFSYPTPFTPPTTEEDDLSVLRLVRSRRVGPATYHRLIQEHGSAEAALAELPAIARAAGLEDYRPCSQAEAQDELAAGRRAGARLLRHGTPDYPSALNDLTDAPPVLWAVGTPELCARPCLAIVGARNASSLGLRMTRILTQELAEAGFVIVSGLARGIDAQAHQSALDHGTIAVLGGGVDILYPQENAPLGEAIGQRGLRLSEVAPGIRPQARHFPPRNRIISGLARAVLVIEAATRSGSLLTARAALDQGREVMAIPGHPLDGRAGGCNLLIRDGALLVRSAQDVIEMLASLPDSSPPPPRTGPSPQATPPKPLPETAPQPAPSEPPEPLERRILQRLSPSPETEDGVLCDLGVSASRFARALVDLEISGAIRRHPGGLISRLS